MLEACGLILVSARLVRGGAEQAIGFGALALLPMFTAAGWAAMSTAASIVALAALLVAAGAAVVIGRFALLRAAHAVVAATAAMLLAAVIALAVGAFAPIAGFAAAAVAGVTVLPGTHLRRDTADGVALELTGVAGIVVSATVAAPRRRGWPPHSRSRCRSCCSLESRIVEWSTACSRRPPRSGQRGAGWPPRA